MRRASAVAALLLLLPMIGPLADHHFAERLPNHNHLWIGAREPSAHVHLVGQPHSHTRSAGTQRAIFYADGQGEGSVLYFAPYDGWTPPAVAAVALSLAVVAALLLGLAAAPLCWGHTLHPIFARSVDLPPPENPPR